MRRQRETSEWHRSSVFALFQLKPFALPPLHKGAVSSPDEDEDSDSSSEDEPDDDEAFYAARTEVNDHLQRFPGLIESLASSVTAFKESNPIQYAAFLKHTQHAATAASSLVRRFTMWWWI